MIVIIQGITKEKERIVMCINENRHGFQDGYHVLLQRLVSRLNNCSLDFIFNWRHFVSFGVLQWWNMLRVKKPVKVSVKDLSCYSHSCIRVRIISKWLLGVKMSRKCLSGVSYDFQMEIRDGDD